ncbi:hypothetical protein ASD11_11975 [Aeromicrobium sp. Root495]|uniref:2-hydroxyacid dehydrogenase n=1 Tax=Aeromicrobium sp. Root495 TaxID=1736550 RepID=UPI0006F4B3CA|nr:2-hydroxyacid dehydrogenase [Aeromicrobium sp. Root495]KQY60184.1 hypothetical protein ASD11_11975 [Aeromicrobium sp. Root495]
MTVRISLPDEQTRDRFSDLDVDSVVWDFSGPPPADGPPLDLAVRPYVLTGDLSVLDAHRVRAVQAQSLGYDDAIGNVPDGITWCNAVGVHEGATAEIALGLVLSAQRDLDRYARAMGTGTWEKTWTPGLIGLTVLLVGHGGIGREVERRLAGFDVDVVRVASRARDDAWGHVHGTDELPGLLPTADVVVVAVPLSDSTAGLVDDAFLAALPDGALVVNVGRGRLADHEAVLRHVRSGHVRFAADVWDPEPLPADHPLWSEPGVLVSPHVGGMTHSMHDRVEALVREQVRRLQAGEPLTHVVDAVRP